MFFVTFIIFLRIIDMEIKVNTQEEMIEMAEYFLPSQQLSFMSDFDKYCHSRDLIKSWNQLPIEERVSKSIQIEVYGFNVNTPVWK